QLSSFSICDSGSSSEISGMLKLFLKQHHIDANTQLIFPQVVSLQTETWTIEQLSRMLDDLHLKIHELLSVWGEAEQGRIVQ
ncbi:hypothetical protein, partial [Acinetobacter baumannii]|uniref:hypothetical protein n=1 Tax=Acinetobacter baumannii TaxID=470 RepID=UPI00197AEAE3